MMSQLINGTVVACNYKLRGRMCLGAGNCLTMGESPDHEGGNTLRAFFSLRSG